VDNDVDEFPAQATPRTAGTDAKPAPEDAVPLEILQSRVSTEAHAPPHSVPASVNSKFVGDGVNRAHKSYLLYRADELAQHFAMIDRELFMGVKFEELVTDEWIACEEVNVLDWAQYLKDRARWKAEHRWPEKTSALAAVRGRFNLMANFTISEIVLSQPSKRHLIFSKFLQIAKVGLACGFLCFYTTDSLSTEVVPSLQLQYPRSHRRRPPQ
jgi:Gdp/GTP exchange factor required for growth at low temperatures